MNCTQCGALIDEDKKFCIQCGARIEWKRQETTVGQVSREARAVKKVEDGINVFKERDSGSISECAVSKEVELGGSRDIVGFAELLVMLMTHPMAAGPLLYSHFNKRISCIYMTILVVLSSCITYLSFASISNRIAELFYDVFDYFFGFGMVQYFLGEIGVQVLILSLISNVLFIGCMTGCIIGLYRGIFNIDIEWVECIQLLLMPLAFAFFGKVILFAAALVSAKLIIVLGLILGALVGIFTIIQFVNRLGISAGIIYTMPLIYFFSVFIKYFFVFQVVKDYL